MIFGMFIDTKNKINLYKFKIMKKSKKSKLIFESINFSLNIAMIIILVKLLILL